MPILASEVLQNENKNITPVGIEPRPLITFDSKSDTVLSGLTWYVLFMRSLNFCSCTTWCLDLGDSVRISRVWLYKESKVSVLQANVNLVQKWECWTWNQRLWEALALFPLRVIFFTGYFLFSDWGFWYCTNIFYTIRKNWPMLENFPIYVGMPLIFTDLQQCKWLRPLHVETSVNFRKFLDIRCTWSYSPTSHVWF